VKNSAKNKEKVAPVQDRKNKETHNGRKIKNIISLNRQLMKIFLKNNFVCD
jgi:hypothetical protein